MGEHTADYETPATWPEKLREAAEWFDTVDKLLDMMTVTVTATGETYKLLDKIDVGREVQDDLLLLADIIEHTPNALLPKSVERPGDMDGFYFTADEIRSAIHERTHNGSNEATT